MEQDLFIDETSGAEFLNFSFLRKSRKLEYWLLSQEEKVLLPEDHSD